MADRVEQQQQQQGGDCCAPIETSTDVKETRPICRVLSSAESTPKTAADKDDAPPATDSSSSGFGFGSGASNLTVVRMRTGVASTSPVGQQDFDHLMRIIHELDIRDQLLLSQNYQRLPSACSQLWHANAMRLDFRYLKQELLTAEDQFTFLNDMKKEIKCLFLGVELLQEHLHILERAGIATLDSVEECHLMLGNPHHNHCDMQQNSNGPNRVGYPEWPLHSLPKLMKNVRHLRVHCNIQVHFIERFTQLELLALYGSISQSALTGVFEHCRQLERLFIKTECDAPLDLSGVAKCPSLNGISLPVSLFANQRQLLVGCPKQQLIELSHCGRNSRLTVECLRTIFDVKSEAIEGIQMDCGWLEHGAQGLAALAMNRCTRVRSLVLGNCDFRDVAIEGLQLPQVQRYIALNRCHNVTNKQVLAMVEQCPALRELYIIEGSQLTGSLLHGICRIRYTQNPGYPLVLILANCKRIVHSYSTLYAEFWESKQNIIQIEYVDRQSKPITDIQIFFHGFTQQNIYQLAGQKDSNSPPDSVQLPQDAAA